MKSSFLTPVSCLLGMGALTLASSTVVARAEMPSTDASVTPVRSTSTFIDRLTLDPNFSQMPASTTGQTQVKPIPVTNTKGSVAGGSPTATSIQPVAPVTKPGALTERVPTPIEKATDKPGQTHTQPTHLATSNKSKLKSHQASEAKQGAIAVQPTPGTAATSAALLTLPSQTSGQLLVLPARRETTIAQTDLDVRRGTVGVPNYVGVGGNIGLGGGDDEDDDDDDGDDDDNDGTALGSGGFVVNSKIGLSTNLSLRPGIILGDDAVFLIPLTYDFLIPRVDPFEPVRFAPFLGGGVAISTDDDASIGFLLTGGIDIPLSRAFVANASLNVGFIEDNTDFGLILGIGYTFPDL